MRSVPPSRIREQNAAPLRPEGEIVLYWMIAARRTHHSFALQRAVALAVELDRPLVVLEGLRAGYRWASDRLHRFVLDGMADNERRFAGTAVLYYPYVEPTAGAGKGLLEALAARAAVVVTDDFPAFFLPRMVAAAAKRCPVRLEAVDGNGIYPMWETGRVFTTAASFRLHLQKSLLPHLAEMPLADPLARAKLHAPAKLPASVTRRWPRAAPALLAGDLSELAALPIDHGVQVCAIRGGAVAGEAAMRRFVDNKLGSYPDDRDDPDRDGGSGLSPYLHFGHVSAHQVFERVIRSAGWTVSKLAPKPHGRREGWWNAGGAADAFLDQLVTWRELGYNMCSHRDDYAELSSLPGWAQATLAKHAGDRRPQVYDLPALEQARTHDVIWNAAQRQLLREGRMHNYLRMLWGKKVLEWSRTPEDALAALIELNNKYALDGRNPNSYSGILWTFGRYDRAWGPEREIFGTVRYLSSDSARKKLKLAEYLVRYGA